MFNEVFLLVFTYDLRRLSVCSGSGQLPLRDGKYHLTDIPGRSNIFTIMNTINKQAEKSIADYLKVLGSPIRIQILFSIGYGEACVCHLEALLRKRQAYISQHLMVLRDAGILDTRRDGKYIYYRVADKKIFGLIQTAADLLEMPPDSLPSLEDTKALSNCECPKCQPTTLSIKME